MADQGERERLAKIMDARAYTLECCDTQETFAQARDFRAIASLLREPAPHFTAEDVGYVLWLKEAEHRTDEAIAACVSNRLAYRSSSRETDK